MHLTSIKRPYPLRNFLYTSGNSSLITSFINSSLLNILTKNSSFCIYRAAAISLNCCSKILSKVSFGLFLARSTSRSSFKKSSVSWASTLSMPVNCVPNRSLILSMITESGSFFCSFAAPAALNNDDFRFCLVTRGQTS